MAPAKMNRKVGDQVALLHMINGSGGRSERATGKIVTVHKSGQLDVKLEDGRIFESVHDGDVGGNENRLPRAMSIVEDADGPEGEESEEAKGSGKKSEPAKTTPAK